MRDLEFCGDDQARQRFAAAVEEMTALGGRCVEIDFRPFQEAARLLYEGPWIAERRAVLGDFLRDKPEAMLPVLRDILGDGAGYDAVAAFRGRYRLEALRRITEGEWQRIDLLMVPTTPTIYTIAQVLAEPRRLNQNLGVYTNFVNLLDLGAIAVPNGFRGDGLPSGITLIGPRGSDADLATVAAAYHRRAVATLGATPHPHPPAEAPGVRPALRHRHAGRVRLAVVGAHLSGQPLNHQLVEGRARLVRRCATAAAYRLFLLPGQKPAKPGLVRVESGIGAGIEVEVWEMTTAAFGAFVAKVPSPLCIGTLLLEDGEAVHGFLCEAFAVTGALDISQYGGWRAYLDAMGPSDRMDRGGAAPDRA
jgi:allophanate hydrolase